MAKRNKHSLPPGGRKVLAGGCFDVLHFGHVRFLKEAKNKGDYLVIALESDENTKKLKGQSRPIHNQKQRSEILKSLNFVDEVISLPPMNGDEDYKKLVSKIKPDIIAITKGDTMKDKKKEYAGLVGAKLVEIKKINVPSTTQIAKLIGLE
jgi:rfaE bifunctional protein nucleotidyltransferase chain/domain